MPHGSSCSVLPGIAWGLMFELIIHIINRCGFVNRPGLGKAIAVGDCADESL